MSWPESQAKPQWNGRWFLWPGLDRFGSWPATLCPFSSPSTVPWRVGTSEKHEGTEYRNRTVCQPKKILSCSDSAGTKPKSLSATRNGRDWVEKIFSPRSFFETKGNPKKNDHQRKSWEASQLYCNRVSLLVGWNKQGVKIFFRNGRSGPNLPGKAGKPARAGGNPGTVTQPGGLGRVEMKKPPPVPCRRF